MPRFDGTGPLGFGPMTGRRLGYCAGAPMWFGIGRGPGRGRGWRNMYLATQQEATMLKQQATALEEQLKEINQRLKELDKKEASSEED